MARLKEKYNAEIVPTLMKEFEYDNVMQVPKLQKIVVNIVIKHIKRGRARQAGRIEVEAPLPVAKVKLVCPSCGQPTRVGVHAGADGKNVRFCKSCEKDIPRPQD